MSLVYSGKNSSFTQTASNVNRFEPLETFYTAPRYSYMANRDERIHHILSLISRSGRIKIGPNSDRFNDLMCEIRLKCLIESYNLTNKFRNIIQRNLRFHQGWTCDKTREQILMLHKMQHGLSILQQDNTNTSPFEDVDKEFSIYRHIRWLEVDHPEIDIDSFVRSIS